MLELSPAERRDLRARAHHLNPVVSIAGNGLTEGVLKEIDVALKAHELIKVRIYGDDRDARAVYLEQICAELDCAAVQNIGKLLVIFRPNPVEVKPEVATPAKTRTGRPGRFSRKEVPTGPSTRRAGRPATAKPPRMALRGQDAPPRIRKAAAGSSRTRKSAR